jgi:hypothetical protein
MLHPKNPNEMPDIEVTQEELKQLVAFAGIMAIGVHYGVDPSVSVDQLPEEIENNGGMLGLMMNTIRASEAVGELLSEIIDRAETAQRAKLDEAFQQIVNPSE